MRRSRLLLAHAVILFIVGGSTYDIVRDEEHWPFSQYPMFNRVNTSKQLAWLRLYGVTAAGDELALVRYQDVYPFDQSRLSKALGSIRMRPDPDAALWSALADCLERYERRREQGLLDGPPLVALRLYDVRWHLDPQAANVDNPDVRRLVAEVRR
jgi:hypothetical protein